MRKNLFMKKSLVFLLVFPVILFFFCGGKRTTRTTEPEYEFTINGVVVKDLSLGKDIAYFTILRDSVAFDSALVKVGSDTLESEGGGAYSKEASHLFDFEGAITITVSSAEDDFAVDFNLIIPGFFRIIDITGISGREVHSGESPQIHFTASANASGYFISVVPRDNAEGAQGHTNLMSWSGVGQYTIPVHTFTDRFGNFTEGTYAIYLVAYNKSFVAYPPHMEFELPDGLPEGNISGANGTIGAGVVAPLDSVEAVVVK
jgi:hypothetical protein